MKFLSPLILIFVALLMTACVSDSKSAPQNTSSSISDDTSDMSTSASNENETSSTSGTEITSSEETNPNIETTTTPVEEEPLAAQAEILPWLRVPMHYEVLLGQPHIWGETGATLSLRLANPALAESKTVELNSTRKLLPMQLISYLGENGEYYTAQIQSIENKTLLLTTPLEKTIPAGANAWNFYDNGSHPNSRGYNAIADYAVRLLGKEKLNEGIHVLLGDSWFDEGSVFKRLKHHLPAASIINKGIGGNTSTNLLARFDEDVLPYNPNFVWIMAGTNDCWQGITAATYKTNLSSLVSKIKDANAVPIIFDASVGQLNAGSDTITILSHSYVTAIDQILAESE